MTRKIPFLICSLVETLLQLVLEDVGFTHYHNFNCHSIKNKKGGAFKKNAKNDGAITP